LSIYVFLLIGCMVFPAGPFIRPHPIVWRFVFGCSLIYLFILIILVLLPIDKSRQLLKVLFFDENLGKLIILPNYATDCTVSVANILSKCDRFVFAHFLGWFAKGLLIRQRELLWFASFMWELLEKSTVYMIPNFAECWWDSWIMDFLICNGLGIELGLACCKYFEKKEYKWSVLVQSGTICDKFKRVIKQFTPSQWTKVEWESNTSIKRFIQVHILLIGLMIIEFNAFLLKLFLWIPTEHWFNIVRMFLFLFVGFPAMRQYYFYVTDPNITKMGSQLFILILLIILECCLVYKSCDNMKRAPLINIVSWITFAALYLLFTYIMCCKYNKHAVRTHNK